MVCEDTSGVAAKMATSIWVLCVGPPLLQFPCLFWLVSGHRKNSSLSWPSRPNHFIVQRESLPSLARDSGGFLNLHAKPNHHLLLSGTLEAGAS